MSDIMSKEQALYVQIVNKYTDLELVFTCFRSKSCEKPILVFVGFVYITLHSLHAGAQHNLSIYQEEFILVLRL